MPNPTPGDLHVNVPLTNISIAYIQSAEGFIADKVFPNVPVQKQSDRYFKYLKEDWFRVEAQERAPGTESAGSGWRVDNTPTYYCPIYAVHKDIDDPTRANADAPINLDRDATEWVTQQLLLKRETQWANNYFTTGVWGTDRQGVASGATGNQFVKWSDFTNSNPVLDVKNSVLAIASKTGYKPNVMVVAPDVFNVLTEHPKILDRVKYTQRAVITEDILAGLFGVDKFLVPWGVVNTAAEGATENTDLIFKSKVLLVYAAPAPSLLKPSGGYTFSWTGYLGAGAQGNRIKRFRMEHLSSDRVEGEMAYDMKVVAPDLGVLFYDAI
ncbi:MAG: major capsid protein [Clostridia bacterium]|nr:major capsid protein [Clostridia bacterium]